MRNFDKFQYIRDYYGVPAYKGMRVNVYGKFGVITDADGAYICVRLDGAKHAGNYHPTDGVTYLIENVNSVIQRGRERGAKLNEPQSFE